MPWSTGMSEKRDGERTDRTHHVDLMAELVHVFELIVEIEPFRPAVEMRTGAGGALIVISAGLVDVGAGIVVRLHSLSKMDRGHQ